MREPAFRLPPYRGMGSGIPRALGEWPQIELELKHRPNFRTNYLRPALDRHGIESTLPDKRNSRMQQYRLTAKGKGALK